MGVTTMQADAIRQQIKIGLIKTLYASGKISDGQFRRLMAKNR